MSAWLIVLLVLVSEIALIILWRICQAIKAKVKRKAKAVESVRMYLITIDVNIKRTRENVWKIIKHLGLDKEESDE